MVKSKSRYSCASVIYFDLGPEIIQENCASVIYFDLGPEIIQENCEFEFYSNKSNIKPAVHDSGHQIILANWPSYKKIMCSYNNNIPINIPNHLYVLLNRSILCNCDVEAESSFLMECSQHVKTLISR